MSQIKVMTAVASAVAQVAVSGLAAAPPLLSLHLDLT
jgi:hypothetical protein